MSNIGGQLTQRMETLGLAYQLTGREEFGRHGAALLRATTERYPVTQPVVREGFAGGRGDIMRGLAVGYDLLSERLDAGQRRAVAEVCAGYIEFFREEFENPKSWWYRVHNYNGVNGGAAGCLALALKDAYSEKVDEWTTHCRQIIDRWLSTGFDEGGAYMEGVGYSGYGLSNTALFGDALRHAFFVYPRAAAPAYAIILDDIRKDDQPHEFAWQMMLADGMAVTLGDGRAVLEPQDASGSAYVETPATASETLTAVDPQQGACRFDLSVAAAGEYTVWARVRTLAEESGKSDSFFVQMDDGKPLAWHMPGKRTWTWGRVTSGPGQDAVSFKLEAGRHTLAFLPREPGAQLDCLLVTLEREKAPWLPVPASAGLFFEAEAGVVTAPMRSVRCDPPEARLVLRIHADSAPVLGTDVFEPEDYHGPAAFPRVRAVTQTVTPNFLTVLLPLPAGVKEPDVSFGSGPADRTIRIAWPSHEDVLAWPHDGARAPEFR